MPPTFFIVGEWGNDILFHLLSFPADVVSFVFPTQNFKPGKQFLSDSHGGNKKDIKQF